MLRSFFLVIAGISARLFIHSKTLPLELVMKWMLRMCVSRMRSLLLFKVANGTTIGFLDGKNLEKISLFCAEVNILCTFQQRIGVLLVLLHNRLVPRKSSMQNQLTLTFLTASNCFKKIGFVVELSQRLRCGGVQH